MQPVPIVKINALAISMAGRNTNPQRRRSLYGMLNSSSAAAKLAAVGHVLPQLQVTINSSGDLFAVIEDDELREKAIALAAQ